MQIYINKKRSITLKRIYKSNKSIKYATMCNIVKKKNIDIEDCHLESIKELSKKKREKYKNGYKRYLGEKYDIMINNGELPTPEEMIVFLKI
tara:strand:+ start:5599 stop:5874 length:276 start_codon:yes stop_codon:yes gene_type:complete